MRLLSLSSAATEPVSRRLVTGFALILCVAALVMAAKTQIPFFPVPMTLHTLAVAVFALAFGPRFAVTVFATYLGLGALGLPVFSGTPERGIGLAYMAGPTGGCLIGYLIASDLIGRFGAGRGLARRLAAAYAGMAVVYVFDMAWLLLYVPVERVFAVGVAPFLVGDTLKLAIAALAAPALAGGMRRLGGERS